ncbi:MAG: UvrD-helicase domain-containing protein [Geothrix sp.]|nr:UvrD-helicase domain-containing protein [Geothrix sp.]
MTGDIRVPRPAVLDRIPRPFAVLEASAGTGKTYTLEHLVLDRVLEGIPLEQILVVTFTEKAALELRARVRARLAWMLEPAALDSGDGPWWILDEGARARLRQARGALERAPISTIHSFCQRVLQESALERRSLFDEAQADARQLFDRAWREQLRRASGGDPALRELLGEALADGQTVEGLEDLLWQAHRERARLLPDLEAAEAHRQAFPPGLDPQAIGAGWAAAKVHAGTLKAATGRLAPFLDLLPRSAYAFASGLKALGFDSLRKASSKAGLQGDAQVFAEWCLAFEPPTPEGVLVQALLPAVQQRLAVIKDSEGLYDFDDMILRVREALEGPGGPALAARLRERFRVAFIDECQDTDAAQWDIFRTLFHQDGHELVLVGDPKQAIYGFRGGDLPTYLAARDLLAGPRKVDLAENFRSTEPLLQACAALFSGPHFFTGEVAFVPVTCGRPELGLEDAEGRPLPPLRVLRVEELEGGARLWRRVALGLARDLKELLDSGARFGKEGRREGLSPKDAFVLVGKASEGRLMAEALGAVGLPFAFFKQKGLFRGPEARAWLHLLQAIEDPRDRGRLARALLSPFFGLALPELEGIRDPREDHPALQRLRAWGELARRRRFAELVEQILRDSAVIERLLLLEEGERAITNLRHIGELLARAAAERHGDLAQLIRQLRRWRKGLDLPPGENGDEQRVEGRENAIQILTLHAAKGLEAPVVAVFAPGAAKITRLRRFHDDAGRRCLCLGAAPEGSDLEARIEAEEAHEQERLMYVALTRAQARLVVPCFIVDSTTKASPGESKHPRGPLKVLNRVLRPLLEQDALPGASVIPLEEVEAAAPEEPRPALKDWVLPPSRISAPPLVAEALRAAARPRRTTSFTALQRRITEAHISEAEDPEPDSPGAAPDGLPRGRQVGTLLHELLEAVDPALLRGRSFEAWWKEAAIREPILRRAALAGLGTEAAQEGARRVFLGFTTPLPLRGGESPLLEADRLLREMDFLTGLPGGRDFLGGSMDALFEKEGRVYLLDWKSNSLPDYGPESLSACISGHYELQVRIYTLAVLRFLGVTGEAAYEARFGGALYVFLRGLPEGGVWFFRPTWSEVRAWEQALANLGGEVPGG